MSVRATFKNGSIYLIDKKKGRDNSIRSKKHHLNTTSEIKDEGGDDSILTHIDSS